jgi:putative membrane protein
VSAHGDHAAVAVPWAAAAIFLLLAAPYLHAAARTADWSRWRTALWLSGSATAALALSPLAAGPEPVAHMARHLLLGMYAPIGLVLGAPLTLLLRTLPTASARRLTGVLRRRPVQWLGRPCTAAALSVGGLVAVMLTPVHDAAARHPLLHGLLLAHYLASGYLFTWSLIGPDPAPHRPGLPTRAAALAAAIAAHAILAKHLYAQALPAGHDASAARTAAQLMYYGGDVAELIVAFILFGTLYRKRLSGVARGRSGYTVGGSAAKGRCRRREGDCDV